MCLHSVARKSEDIAVTQGHTDHTYLPSAVEEDGLAAAVAPVAVSVGNGHEYRGCHLATSAGGTRRERIEIDLG